MSDDRLTGAPSSSVSDRQPLDEQRRRWQAGDPVPAEEFIRKLPETAGRADLALDLIYQEIILREAAGQFPQLEEYVRSFPEFEPQLRRQFAVHQALPTPTKIESAPGTDLAVTLAGPAAGVETSPYATVPLSHIPLAGALVGGYRIVEELGRGGMGVVYKAYDPTLRRQVALKMILAGPHAGTELRRRFLDEARNTAQLQHPHIVQIHEVSEQDSLPFLVLEFVDGPSLANYLKGKPIEPAEAARLIALLARAVQAAHERGIVHRDLKPANILLTGARREAKGDSVSLSTLPSPLAAPKITDFGLAKQMDDKEGLSSTGCILGTPSYMAPEQAAGQVCAVGPGADVYALGAILYECLTGRPPFLAASPVVTIRQVIEIEPVPPRQLQPVLPRDVETICLKCLHKEARRRYATAGALADDLERFLEGKPVLARPVGPGERLVKWVRRRPGITALAAALLLALGLGITALVVAWRQAEAAGRAETARAEAEADKRRQVERELYFNRIALADRELAANKPAWAEEQLDLCPPNLRRWEWFYLDRLCRDGPLPPLVGHTRGVSSVAVHPGGRVAASSGGDGMVRIWSIAERKPEGVLIGPRGSVNWVTFSPDGQTVASAGEDGRVLLWDWQRQSERQEAVDHGGPVACVAFHPRGRQAASAAFGGPRPDEVLIWKVLDGHIEHRLRGHAARVVGLACSPDGATLATASHDRTVRLWDAETGIEQRVFAGHTLPVGAVAFSPDGKLAASAGGRVQSDRPDEGEVLLWEPATGQVRHRLRGHTGRPVAVAFHPDGERLATGAWDGEIKLWDVATGREVLTLRGHTAAVMGVAFTPDGTLLVSGSLDRDVRLWPTAAPE